jgi:glycogen phosphorylase
MLRDYVRELYAPAAASARRLAEDDRAAARSLAAWKHRVAKAWPVVAVEHVESGGAGPSPEERVTRGARPSSPHLGSTLAVRATVQLGELTPEDVAVEVAYGRVDETDSLVDPAYLELTPAEAAEGGRLRYAGEVPLDRPGPFGYSVRVVPRHELLVSRAEMGLLVLPPAPIGMTNGDLR